MQYILSIDEGTTGTRALVIDRNVRIRGQAYREFKQYYPRPGWVEHDPHEIWHAVLDTIAGALKKARVRGDDIAAIGITNQRETTILWDRQTGKAVYPAIVWQDRRTAAFCDQLRRKGHLPRVTRATGLVLDPYFSATKIRWVLDHVPDACRLLKKGRLAFGTMDTYLTWMLTGGRVHVTDVSNASRTLLLNLRTLNWDAAMLKIFGIPRTILPEVRSSSEVYGTTLNVRGLPERIPVAGMAGDQQSALFGQLCFRPGEAKCTYGTGSFLLMNIGKRPVLSRSLLLTTVAWRLGKNVSYALEGSSFIAGAVVQWLRDELKIIKTAPEIEPLARSVPDNGGVFFVPAFAGLGAPYWDAGARGTICGLTRGSRRGHIARAALEGIALSQYDILEAVQRDCGHRLKNLKVDGGASANNLLMQIQSDVLGCEIVRPQVIETTALGCAFMAGLAVGFWKDQGEISKGFKIKKKFKPQITRMQRENLVGGWKKAVEKTVS